MLVHLFGGGSQTAGTKTQHPEDVVVKMGNRRGHYMDLILCYSRMVVEL